MAKMAVSDQKVLYVAALYEKLKEKMDSIEVAKQELATMEKEFRSARAALMKEFGISMAGVRTTP